MTNKHRLTTTIDSLPQPTLAPHETTTAGGQPHQRSSNQHVTVRTGRGRSAGGRLFNEPTLESPDVTIRSHADTGACDSHPGSHRTVATGSQIDIRTAGTGAFEQTVDAPSTRRRPGHSLPDTTAQESFRKPSSLGVSNVAHRANSARWIATNLTAARIIVRQPHEPAPYRLRRRVPHTTSLQRPPRVPHTAGWWRRLCRFANVARTALEAGYGATRR
jgi:hypothetical protein